MAEPKKKQITYDQYDAMIDAISGAGLEAFRNTLSCEGEYPTVEELKKGRVEEKLERYLPFLIFYSDIYQSKDDEFKKTRSYLRTLLTEKIELVDEIGQAVVSQDEYDYMTAIGRKVLEDFNDSSLFDYKRKFITMNSYPTVAELEAHHVADNLKKYLPYLAFYADVYESDEAEFKKTKAYIRHLLYDAIN